MSYSSINSPKIQNKRLGGMFTENKLIRKITDINISRNPRNEFQRVSYSSAVQNEIPKIIAKKALIKLPFEDYRKQKLSERYFGKDGDKESHLLNHTKNPEEANFIKTCTSISQNLGKLHQLSERSLSCSCGMQDVSVLSQISCKPRTAVKTEFSPLLNTNKGSLIRTAMHKEHPSMYNSVRIYSPQKSGYIYAPAEIENNAQRMIYTAMRGSQNNGTMKAAESFEKIKLAPLVKAFNGSTETYKTSWVDMPRVQATHNYESSKFDIISHGYGKGVSISTLLRQNPQACNRLQSIAKYTDISKVTSAKPCNLFESAMRQYPQGFQKSTSLCAKQADFGKTYGPFFKLFK